MKVILSNGQAREINIAEACIEEILNTLGINPVEVVVAKNGKIVSELESVGADDELRVIRIIHGG